jgi:hypothetical protein
MNKYLIEILKLQNSVILPGLGALMIPSQKTGKVFFNQHLKFNDGSLARYLAENEGVELQEAQNKVAKFVREIEAQIGKGEAYDMFEFGKFFKDETGDIKFEMSPLFVANAETSASEAPGSNEKPVIVAPVATSTEAENLATQKEAEAKKAAELEAQNLAAQKEAEAKKAAELEAQNLAIQKEAETKKAAEHEAQNLAAQKEAEAKKAAELEAQNLTAQKEAEAKKVAELEAQNLVAQKETEAKKAAELEAQNLASQTEAEAKKAAELEAQNLVAQKETEAKKAAELETQNLATQKEAEAKKAAELETQNLATQKEAEAKKAAELEAQNLATQKEADAKKAAESINEVVPEIVAEPINTTKIVPPVIATPSAVEDKQSKNTFVPPASKPAETAPTDKKKRSKLPLILLLLLLIGLCVVGFIFKDQITGYFDKSTATNADSSATNTAPIVAEDTTDNVVEEPDTLTEAVTTDSLTTPEEVVEEPVAPAPVESSSSGRFHLVGNSFGEKANAEKYVSQLSEKGFSASIIGRFDGLYLVSVKGYDTKEAAKNDLDNVRKDVPKAWLFELKD